MTPPVSPFPTSLECRDDPHDNRPNGSPTITVIVERIRGEGSMDQLQLFLTGGLIDKIPKEP